jgi:hypothetical protein
MDHSEAELAELIIRLLLVALMTFYILESGRVWRLL